MVTQQAPSLPSGLVNAPFEQVGKFVMRVGIPHRGGRLAFHAFNEGYAAMVSASAFWSHSAGAFRLPPGHRPAGSRLRARQCRIHGNAVVESEGHAVGHGRRLPVDLRAVRRARIDERRELVVAAGPVLRAGDRGQSGGGGLSRPGDSDVAGRRPAHRLWVAERTGEDMLAAHGGQYAASAGASDPGVVTGRLSAQSRSARQGVVAVAALARGARADGGGLRRGRSLRRPGISTGFDSRDGRTDRRTAAAGSL